MRQRLGWRALPLLVVVVVASACGSSDIVTTAPTSPTAPAAPGGNGADLCPAPDLSHVPTMTIGAGGLPDPSSQEPLLADADVVRRYGDAHPDEFNEVWFDYRNGAWMLVVGFKSGVAEHRAALLGQLEHPDRVLVCRSPLSSTDRQRIMAELQALAGADGRLTSLGFSAQGIVVTVRADQESLAKQLYDKYGPAIDIKVGARPYPPGASGTVDQPCIALPSLAPPPGVTVTVEPASASLVSGTSAKVTVRIRNSSTRVYTGSQGTIAVVRPGTHTVVGLDVGARDMMLRVFRADAGGEGTIDDTFGTAPCGPGDGYTLPKGTYEVIATVGIDGVGQVISAPTRIELR
jgi:hypothetical protein